MSTKGDPPDMAQLLAMVEDLRQHNETLQDSVATLQLQSQIRGDDNLEEDILEPQLLSQSILDEEVHENFKFLSLASYHGKSNPHENIIAISNQMEIITPSNLLKCKLMAETFKEVVHESTAPADGKVWWLN